MGLVEKKLPWHIIKGDGCVMESRKSEVDGTRFAKNQKKNLK